MAKVLAFLVSLFKRGESKPAEVQEVEADALELVESFTVGPNKKGPGVAIVYELQNWGKK